VLLATPPSIVIAPPLWTVSFETDPPLTTAEPRILSSLALPADTVSKPPEATRAAESEPPSTTRKPPLSIVGAETLPPLSTNSVLPAVSV
jgi:hypothetical protein